MHHYDLSASAYFPELLAITIFVTAVTKTKELVAVTSKNRAKIFMLPEIGLCMGTKYVKTVDLHIWFDPDVYLKMREKADELDMGVSTWARMAIIKVLRAEPSNSTRSTPGNTPNQEAPDNEPSR
jgi:hypothetical protein